MEEYSFLADLLESYRASPDIIKALWVLTPPGSVLALAAILRMTRRPAAPAGGERSDAMSVEAEVVLLRADETAALQAPLAESEAGRAPVSFR